jgi:hypothetical protein
MRRGLMYRITGHYLTTSSADRGVIFTVTAEDHTAGRHAGYQR